MINRKLARGGISVAGLFLLLEAAGRTGLLDTQVIPLMSDVVAAAARLVADPQFLGDVRTTLTVWAAGLLITTLVTVPVGVLLGSASGLEATLRPLIEFLRPIPSVALIPLVTLMVDSDSQMKIAIIIYAACWPVLVNTVYGLHDVDPLAKETLRSFGFGRLAVLLRVALPSAAPFALTGVRLAAGIGLVVAISAELLSGGAGGIGVFILKAGSGYRLDNMLAATFWAGAIGLIVNALLVRVERGAFRWHTARAEVAA